MAEDAYGKIWIGGFSNGLGRYDPVSGIFRRYPVIGNSGNEMQQVNKIIALKNGEVWFATGHMGLAEYIQGTDSFRFYKPVALSDKFQGEWFSVRDIRPDPGNDSLFWLISGNRIFRFNRFSHHFREIYYVPPIGEIRSILTVSVLIKIRGCGWEPGPVE